MFINLRELELKKVRFDEQLPAGAIDYDLSEIRQVGPLSAIGVAELLHDTLGEIRLQGHVQVTMEVPCDRCLEPTQYSIDTDFDLYYRPAPKTDEVPHEVEIGAGEIELGFYEGIGIELKDVLREFILLSLPMQQVCREACLGICPKCGSNRNTGPCDCSEKVVNDRWSALRDWKAGARVSSEKN